MYLLDGYNLLHAMGVLGGRVGPQGLQKARLRLLGLLQAVYGSQTGEVTVVFDAKAAPPGAVATHDHHGIHVRFAVHQEEADDLIEELIRHDSAPRQLCVVSDDHRIQQAARRRQCQVLACAEYLDELDRRRRPAPRPAENEDKKETTLSAEERQHWLEEFADLENDPHLGGSFYPYDEK